MGTQKEIHISLNRLSIGHNLGCVDFVLGLMKVGMFRTVIIVSLFWI